VSLLVFLGHWQLAAASGAWNETFVPYPSTVWRAFLRALPPLAYFFLLVIWLGIDEAPKITLLALAAFPPAAVATTAAVAAAPISLIEAARALGANRSQVIRDVIVPAALPETFTGVRLAVGIAYSSVVAAELFNGIPGIGGMVKDASNTEIGRIAALGGAAGRRRPSPPVGEGTVRC